MLPMTEETAPALRREHIVEFILDALRKHPDSPALQSGALFCLWALFVVEPQFAIEAILHGGFGVAANLPLPSSTTATMFLCGTLWSMIAPVVKGIPSSEIPKQCEAVALRIRSSLTVGMSEEVSRCISNLLACSRRQEPPAAVAAVAEGKCTRTALPKCTSSACPAISGRFCTRCSVPQYMAFCVTCDGISALKPYC
jgi:hypothetical protein